MTQVGYTTIVVESLEVNSELSELDGVLGWFAQARPSQISNSTWLQLELALAEAFTNAVRHAHKLHPSSPTVRIELSITPTNLELRIWDHGPEFDLETRLKNLPQHISPDQDGGRGLKLLQNIADRIRYQRIGNQNCLILQKNIP